MTKTISNKIISMLSIVVNPRALRPSFWRIPRSAGARYGLDETGHCEGQCSKPGCPVMRSRGEMGVDLSRVDRRSHHAAADRGFLGLVEGDIGGEPEDRPAWKP